MSTISEASAQSSTSFPSSCSSPITVQLVSKSKSERLLKKFYDSFDFELEYEENGQWSPPRFPPTEYEHEMGSSTAPEEMAKGRELTEDEMVANLRRVMVARASGSGGCHRACFHLWGSCISLLFVAIFKKRIHRHITEITYF